MVIQWLFPFIKIIMWHIFAPFFGLWKMVFTVFCSFVGQIYFVIICCCVVDYLNKGSSSSLSPNMKNGLCFFASLKHWNISIRFPIRLIFFTALQLTQSRKFFETNSTALRKQNSRCYGLLICPSVPKTSEFWRSCRFNLIYIFFRGNLVLVRWQASFHP
jgi:hypothetical protein